MLSMLPRRLLPWLFALTLLFGQAAAFAHALGHLNTHDPALPDQTCEVCVAQASLGSGAPPTTVSLSVEPGRPTALPAGTQPTATVSPKCAQARAPPAAI
jgi:hypothetical protein